MLISYRHFSLSLVLSLYHRSLFVLLNTDSWAYSSLIFHPRSKEHGGTILNTLRQSIHLLARTPSACTLSAHSLSPWILLILSNFFAIFNYCWRAWFGVYSCACRFFKHRGFSLRSPSLLLFGLILFCIYAIRACGSLELEYWTKSNPRSI